MPPDLPARVLEKYGPRVQFIKSRNGDGLRLRLNKEQDPVQEAEKAVTFFETFLKSQNAIV